MILEQVSGITYRVYLVPNPVAYTRDVSWDVTDRIPATKKSAASNPEAARNLKPGGSSPIPCKIRLHEQYTCVRI
jgi:hypothetical protein